MNNSCIECRYYLPVNKTFYNRPCGFCANSKRQKPCVSDDKACSLFERDEKTARKKPP